MEGKSIEVEVVVGRVGESLGEDIGTSSPHEDNAIEIPNEDIAAESPYEGESNDDEVDEIDGHFIDL